MNALSANKKEKGKIKNTDVRHREWSRRDASDIDGLSREAATIGTE
jgi:hypothetical protein